MTIVTLAGTNNLKKKPAMNSDLPVRNPRFSNENTRTKIHVMGLSDVW